MRLTIKCDYHSSLCLSYTTFCLFQETLTTGEWLFLQHVQGIEPNPFVFYNGILKWPSSQTWRSMKILLCRVTSPVDFEYDVSILSSQIEKTIIRDGP